MEFPFKAKGVIKAHFLCKGYVFWRFEYVFLSRNRIAGNGLFLSEIFQK